MKSSALQYEDTEPGFQIAPMVDVVFVLMLFFMAFAAFHGKERDLDAMIPSGHGPSTPGVIDIVVAADGTVLVNNTVIGAPADRRLPALTTWLRNLRETFGEDDAVVVHPAPAMTHDRVMEVLAAATAAGWHRLALG